MNRLLPYEIVLHHSTLHFMGPKMGGRLSEQFLYRRLLLVFQCVLFSVRLVFALYSQYEVCDHMDL